MTGPNDDAGPDAVRVLAERVAAALTRLDGQPWHLAPPSPAGPGR